MRKQPVGPGLRDVMKKKVTRREQFLAEMDTLVPWMRLLALIATHYPTTGRKGGRPPMPLQISAGPEIDPGDRFPGDWLRVHFLQNWYALSDPMAEETLYDSEVMRHFAGIELGEDRFRMRPQSTTSAIFWRVTG